MSIVGALVVFVSAFAAVMLKKLTLRGGVAAVLVGLGVYAGTRVAGLLLLAVFFVAGVLATGYRKKEKQALGEPLVRGRTAGQVLANGGIAALAGTVAFFLPAHQGLCLILAAGSLAAAASDTLSSELGTVWGSRFYNVISFQKDQRGLDGVISLEGTLAGIGGAALVAGCYFLATAYVYGALCIGAAGVLGNLVDSLLGATVERRRWLGNDSVNLLNTIVGALTAGALSAL